jgi:hypothetical protein
MLIEFSAEIEVPDGTPLEDVERWLQFELAERAQLSGTNALASHDLHSVGGCKNVFVR